MALVPGHPSINLRIIGDPGDDECWPVKTWRPDGYAEYSRTGLVHRIAWEVAHGHTIPDGHEVHHTCNTRNCVNPAHLELLTAAAHRAIHNPPTDTSRPPDGDCRHGHDWASNGTVTTQGRWVCRTCRIAAGRRHDAKRRR